MWLWVGRVTCMSGFCDGKSWPLVEMPGDSLMIFVVQGSFASLRMTIQENNASLRMTTDVK